MMQWDDLFYYDETSPSCLRWKNSSFGGKGLNMLIHSSGDYVGYKNPRGRWVVNVKRKNYFVHRIIYELLTGISIAQEYIDHINGNPSDNRIDNLRKVSSYLNNRNRGKTPNTSGVVGVSRNGNSFTAQWMLNDRKHSASFSIKKYGECEALALAKQEREKAIETLNSSGAGYTERHGKEK